MELLSVCVCVSPHPVARPNRSSRSRLVCPLHGLVHDTVNCDEDVIRWHRHTHTHRHNNNTLETLLCSGLALFIAHWAGCVCCILWAALLWSSRGYETGRDDTTSTTRGHTHTLGKINHVFRHAHIGDVVVLVRILLGVSLVWPNQWFGAPNGRFRLASQCNALYERTFSGFCLWCDLYNNCLVFCNILLEYLFEYCLAPTQLRMCLLY